MTKRISTEAYQALRDALAVVTWYKRPFQALVTMSLRDSPELVAGLNFSETKRAVADELVRRLVTQESRYQDVAIRFMLEIAAMTKFSDIEQLPEPDRATRLADARAAVAHLQRLTEQFSVRLQEQERLQAEREANEVQAEALRRFEDDVAALRDRFLELQGATDPRQRGYDFESLLSDLFKLYDMEPRLAYHLETEQIDGSLSFDTDDYILEAKWIAEPVSRETADAFAAKVRRKGKNALGLFVAVNGLSSSARATYRESTPFIMMDGVDVYLVLEGRVRLDDVLRTKRRHANETGSCYLPASAIVSGL
ncbi:restriction endonuclease [Ornithinimicrobium flavum]|uniref:restriction endonuclease n=1 Tax=Ornithinimicrobium flavum TaxID=1288636 RepID=UPI00106F5ACD|nr:restriction endonuclease [Ornithinimicrobium flavum]